MWPLRSSGGGKALVAGPLKILLSQWLSKHYNGLSYSIMSVLMQLNALLGSKFKYCEEFCHRPSHLLQSQKNRGAKVLDHKCFNVPLSLLLYNKHMQNDFIYRRVGQIYIVYLLYKYIKITFKIFALFWQKKYYCLCYASGFFYLVCYRGICNKKVCKVKNFQVWVASR